jgi:hypothetical protein
MPIFINFLALNRSWLYNVYKVSVYLYVLLQKIILTRIELKGTYFDQPFFSLSFGAVETHVVIHIYSDLTCKLLSFGLEHWNRCYTCTLFALHSSGKSKRNKCLNATFRRLIRENLDQPCMNVTVWFLCLTCKSIRICRQYPTHRWPHKNCIDLNWMKRYRKCFFYHDTILIFWMEISWRMTNLAFFHLIAATHQHVVLYNIWSVRDFSFKEHMKTTYYMSF